MAKADNAATTPDRALVRAAGAISSAAAGAWVAMPCNTFFNVVLAGTFSAVVVVECSYDGGDTVVPLCDESGQPASYTSPGSRAGRANETDTLVRVRAATYLSGTINWRISS
jgi:hypothetical protein